MEHLAALHASQRRQPPAKGITSSVGARLTDAEGCTSHPVAGEADPDNSDKISIQNFKLLQKTTCCCAFPWERQEATAELSVVYNKIIIFSSESEALLKGHTGTRMWHRQQEVDLWDFPCEEIAWEAWVSWSFTWKTVVVLSLHSRQALWPLSSYLCVSTSVSAGTSHCRDTQNPRIALENFSTPEQKG